MKFLMLIIIAATFSGCINVPTSLQQDSRDGAIWYAKTKYFLWGLLGSNVELHYCQTNENKEGIHPECHEAEHFTLNRPRRRIPKDESISH